MKKLCVVLIVLCLTGPAVIAQTTFSDLALITSDLITNAIDWTAGPNEQFNKLENNYILGGLDFTGPNIGYYKAGSIPFAIRTDFDLWKNTDTVSESGFMVDTTIDRPLFNTYDMYLSGTVGLPKASNLSIGLNVYLYGQDYGFDRESLTASRKLVDRSGTLGLEVPFGFNIGTFYNYGRVSVFSNSYEYKDSDDPSLTEKESQVYFALYDKLRMPSLFKSGTESAVWVFYNSPRKNNVLIDVSESQFGIGASNRFDLELAEGISLILNPYVQTGGIFIEDSSIVGVKTSSIVIAQLLGVQTALSAKLGSSPFTVSAGVVPSIAFDWQKRTVKALIDTESYGYGVSSESSHAALLCITADLPGNVQVDFLIRNNSTYAIECVIPLK